MLWEKNRKEEKISERVSGGTSLSLKRRNKDWGCKNVFIEWIKWKINQRIVWH
jgi:hypothetical protein